MANLTKDKILYSLQLAGVVPGDVLLVHSSLSSIGHVEGGAGAVVDALIEAVGPEGTVAVSTLSLTHPFDPENTKSTVGLISETLRHRPNAIRSLHPIHSIAAIGARAEELCRDHDKAATGCGFGTPYIKLRDMGGKILLLGVDMNRNTTLHAIEDLMNSHYLETLVAEAPVYSDEETITITKFPPGHRDFLKFTPYLRRSGALLHGKIGNAVFQLIDVRKMFGLGLSLVADDPMFFMCENEACAYCSNAYRTLKGE